MSAKDRQVWEVIQCAIAKFRSKLTNRQLIIKDEKLFGKALWYSNNTVNFVRSGNVLSQKLC
jgi:hypothetical protein